MAMSSEEKIGSYRVGMIIDVPKRTKRRGSTEELNIEIKKLESERATITKSLRQGIVK